MARPREQRGDARSDDDVPPVVDAAGTEGPAEGHEHRPEDGLWKKMADLDALSRNEKVDLFDDIAKHHGDVIAGTYFLNGYDFFMVNDEVLIDSQKVNEAQSAAMETFLSGYYEAKRSGADEEDRVLAGRKLLAEAMPQIGDELMSEYKIHLQPRREKIGEVTKRLIEMLRQPGNEELWKIIGAFKIKDTPNEPDAEEIFPEMVIYPRPGGARDGSGMTAGRRNAEQVLTAVMKAVRGLEPEAQKTATPRYNVKLNELVYVAQSGGDFKNNLKRWGLLDEYFDPKTNHAYRHGERPLGQPIERRDQAASRHTGPDWPALHELEENAQRALELMAQEDHGPLEIGPIIDRLDRGLASAKAEAKQFYDSFHELDRPSLDKAVVERKGLSATLNRLQTLRDRLQTSMTLDRLKKRESERPETGSPMDTERRKENLWERMAGWFRRRK